MTRPIDQPTTIRAHTRFVHTLLSRSLAQLRKHSRTHTRPLKVSYAASAPSTHSGKIWVCACIVSTMKKRVVHKRSGNIHAHAKYSPALHRDRKVPQSAHNFWGPSSHQKGTVPIWQPGKPALTFHSTHAAIKRSS